LVEIWKSAERLVDETVTLEGTVAAPVLLDVRVTAIPAAGAGPVSVTVPVDAAPPWTAAGEIKSEETEGGLIVRVAELEPPL